MSGEDQRCTAEPSHRCAGTGEPCDADSRRRCEQQAELERQMARIRHKVLVLSGKGGVGKSTVAVNLAMALSLAGRKVGLLDVDMHGPSIPRLLQLDHVPVHVHDDKLIPVGYENLKVMSLGFLLPDSTEAVIWRGPMKMGVIRQFLADVDWGDLDYLVIDCPPGTGDEPLSVVQLIENATGAIIVTTPQEVALADVRRSITFCRQVKLPVLGVIENMSGFVCPHCGTATDIFKSGGGEQMAAQMGVRFLGRIPLDPLMVEAGDDRKPFVYFYADSPTARAFQRVVRPFLDEDQPESVPAPAPAPS